MSTKSRVRARVPLRRANAWLRCGWAVLLTLALGGCGEKDKVRRTRGAPGYKGMASSNLKKIGKPSVELQAENRAEAKKKKAKAPRSGGGLSVELPKPDEFSERDFVENPEESRDPFRNYLVKQPTKEPDEIVRQDLVYLKTYPIAELKLTGIVGTRTRFAMIKDPRTGRTTILKKRDVIAKERATIFEINRDHLVLLIPRIKPGKKQITERTTMYVDEARKIVDIGSDTLRPDEPGIRLSHGRKRSRRLPKRKEP